MKKTYLSKVRQKLMVFLFVACVSLFGSLAKAQITLAPQDILAGQTLTIDYVIQDNAFFRTDSLKALVYTADSLDWIVHEINMSPVNHHFTATYQVPVGTVAVMVMIADIGETKKHFDMDRSLALVRDPSMKHPSIKGYAALASELNWPEVFRDDNEPDNKRAQAIIHSALNNYKDLKMDPDGRTAYYTVMLSGDSATYAAEAKQLIKRESSKKNISKREIQQLIAIGRILGDYEAIGWIMVPYYKIYPQAKISNQLFDKMKDEQDNKKYLSYIERMSTLEEETNHTFLPEKFFETLLQMNVTGKGWQPLEHYLSNAAPTVSLAQGIASMSGKMLKGSLEEKGAYTEMADGYLREALQITEKELTNEYPSGKNAYTTLRGYRNSVKPVYAEVLSKMSVAQYKLKNYKKALALSEASLQVMPLDDKAADEIFTLSLEKEKGGRVAEEALVAIIKKGRATQGMFEQFRRLFEQNNSVAAAADKYLVSLQSELYEKTEKELLEKVKAGKPQAELFTLKNIKGETVSLSDYRGKVVVLDFWATWCGPCRASFPAMQHAIDKFKADKDVVFLFINIFESQQKNHVDPLQRVKNYISSSGYRFEVLYDENWSLQEKYNIRNIPNKVVIDREGRIVFSVTGGYQDSEADLRKIETMITIAKRN